MSTLTSQEIFDKVVSHLRRQGRKSYRPSSRIRDQLMCAYRGEDGSMCAAGCLIEDSEYSKNFEGLSIGSLFRTENTPISMKERLLPHVDLIRSLQDCHDNFPVDHWEYKFAEIADDFCLSYSPV